MFEVRYEERPKERVVTGTLGGVGYIDETTGTRIPSRRSNLYSLRMADGRSFRFEDQNGLIRKWALGRSFTIHIVGESTSGELQPPVLQVSSKSPATRY